MCLCLYPKCQRDYTMNKFVFVVIFCKFVELLARSVNLFKNRACHPCAYYLDSNITEGVR
jgi:hypothetical protein